MKYLFSALFALATVSSFAATKTHEFQVIYADKVNNYSLYSYCIKAEVDSPFLKPPGKWFPAGARKGEYVGVLDVVLRKGDLEITRFRYANGTGTGFANLGGCNKLLDWELQGLPDGSFIKTFNDIIGSRNLVYKKPHEDSCYKKAFLISDNDPNEGWFVNPEDGGISQKLSVIRLVVPCSGEIVME